MQLLILTKNGKNEFLITYSTRQTCKPKKLIWKIGETEDVAKIGNKIASNFS